MTSVSAPSSVDPGTSRPGVRPTAIACGIAAAGAIVATTVVALLGRAAGAPSDFRQTKPMTYIPLVIIGVIAGAIGWRVTSRRARDPRRTLSRLVPIVLVLSFIPDLALGLSGQPWSGVVTLIVMHLAVAVVAIPVYLRFLPLPRRAG